MKIIKSEISVAETKELQEAVASELKKPDPRPEIAEAFLNEKNTNKS
jgi:hypothetical protein